jgi:GTPase KRas protein
MPVNTAREFKIAMIGGGGVGKSALTVMFVQNTFLEEYDPTIEDSYKKNVLIDGEWANLSILDTAGQEEYRALRDQHFRQSDGFIFVYSIIQRKTIDEVLDMHDQMLRVKDLPADTIPTVLVGNKLDLDEDREIPTEVGIKVAKKLSSSVPFLECSAKTRENVDEMFAQMVRELRRLKEYHEYENPKKLCTLL